MINWKVRIKNKTFWMTIIPALLLLLQQVLSLFGITFDVSDLSSKLLAIVDTVFVVLSILGIVVDHTTAGITDSNTALLYTKPKEY